MHIDTAVSRKTILESAGNLRDWSSAVYSVVFAKEVNYLYAGSWDSAAEAELPHLKVHVRRNKWEQPMSEAEKQCRKTLAVPSVLDLFGMLSVDAQSMASAVPQVDLHACSLPDACTITLSQIVLKYCISDLMLQTPC